MEEDYNLNPAKWVGEAPEEDTGSLPLLFEELTRLDAEASALHRTLSLLLAPVLK